MIVASSGFWGFEMITARGIGFSVIRCRTEEGP